LTATSSGLTPTTSAAFNVTAPPPPPAATQLSFEVQPTATPAGAVITPAIQVAAKDASGGIVATYGGIITIAIGFNPAAGILAGTLSAGAVNGIATFANLSIDKAGTGYTLKATAQSLTGTSAAFNITP
jgi:hypothetical protein